MCSQEWNRLDVAEGIRDLVRWSPIIHDENADSERFTNLVGDLLDRIGLLPLTVRDQVAKELRVEHVNVMDAFVFFAVERAAANGDRRWSERAVLALALLLSAPESLSKDLQDYSNSVLADTDSEVSSSGFILRIVEGNINKPLWSAEQLGVTLVDFCERVASEAPSLGAIYLHELAHRPDLMYIARELSLRFADANFGPLNVYGHTIHPFFRQKIVPGTDFIIRFISRTRGETDQAIVLDFRHEAKSAVLIKGECVPSAILWFDRWKGVSQGEVRAKAISRSPIVELHLSNAWKLPDGTTGEWLGNYGVHILEENSKFLLHFSDGIGPPNFDDFVIEVEFGVTS
jgi:hypothetical protein